LLRSLRLLRRTRTLVLPGLCYLPAIRRPALALLLSAACGGSTTITSDACSSSTPRGTFSFHAQQVLPSCGLPTAFDLSVTVNDAGATGIENGVAFTAQPLSTCELAWRDATTYHVVEISTRYETLVTGGCSAVYSLIPVQ
jgi:hypothetical protein